MHQPCTSHAPAMQGQPALATDVARNPPPAHTKRPGSPIGTCSRSLRRSLCTRNVSQSSTGRRRTDHSKRQKRSYRCSSGREDRGREAAHRACSVDASPAKPTRRFQTDIPAWLVKNPSVGGAVFSGRTAGNEAYQPPADPPRQALSSCPAKSSRFIFLPPASRAISRSVISY